MTAGLIVRDATIYGHGRGDCRIEGARVSQLGHHVHHQRGDEVIEARGGALIPGLADHHLHLCAMAAAASSVDLAGLDPGQARVRIAEAIPDASGWVRAVGYDEHLHGRLDLDRADQWRRDVPIRLQHRSGAAWILNSAARDRLRHGANASHAAQDGWLFRSDEWLRVAVGAEPPSLGPTAAHLVSLGITHVSDATPDTGTAGIVIDAVVDGTIPQVVMLMAPEVDTRHHRRVRLGPRKVVLGDHAAPDFEDLADLIATTHAALRPVAVHCVSREALATSIAAFRHAGTMKGDRIEHCAVADRTAAISLAELGLVVVTQPAFVAERGDAYLDRHAADAHPDLWRYMSLVAGGVHVAPSSDAPYGSPDPWAILRAARSRCTPSGRVLGPVERAAPGMVLARMFARLEDPAGPVRSIHRGSEADLVLLDSPLEEVLEEPDRDRVTAVIVGGQLWEQVVENT